jgi:hypothetical protein
VNIMPNLTKLTLSSMTFSNFRLGPQCLNPYIRMAREVALTKIEVIYEQDIVQ